MKNIYLTDRFFYLFAAVVLLFVISFPVGILFPVAQTVFVLALIIIIVDVMLLFRKETRIKCRRYLPKVFSLGDENKVRISLTNQSNQKLNLTVIDELPVQFQARDFEKKITLDSGQEQTINYTLNPKSCLLYTSDAADE